MFFYFYYFSQLKVTHADFQEIGYMYNILQTLETKCAIFSEYIAEKFKTSSQAMTVFCLLKETYSFVLS